ncbi:MAG: EF-hand domain-containing protein [Burkholderiaceae bacterium]|nr:EF-hand domain-containing protein [Burkholderiaceae bacterium]
MEKAVSAATCGKMARNAAPQRVPAIAAKFDELDKDKDGSLSLDEFTAGYSMK